jgi:transposase
MPSHEASMRNLAKARAKWRPPRPWRSQQEARMIRRFAFQWLTCRGTKPSCRAWARALGVSQTWIQKLKKEFMVDGREMRRLQALQGDPKFPEFKRAQERSEQMRERGELRLLRSSRRATFFERH